MATIQTASSNSSLDSEGSNKSITKSNDEIVSDMSSEFNRFLNLSVDKEEKRFHDSVEMMLTKLDEFFSLVDMIRSDTSLCLTETVPNIQAKCAEMEAVFDKIDRLEDFVSVVRDCVTATEEKVNKAEAELGTVGGLVKKLTSFVSMRKPNMQPIGQRTEYEPVNIFSTEKYFRTTPMAAATPSGSSPHTQSMETGS